LDPKQESGNMFLSEGERERERERKKEREREAKRGGERVRMWLNHRFVERIKDFSFLRLS
jgi:hypothetical protein